MFRATKAVLGIVFATVAIGAPLQGQRKSDLLSAEEIAKAKGTVSTAYDAVAMLRPRWFARHELARIPGRSTDTPQEITVHVYLNDHSVGGADYLKTIPAEQVEQLRWMSQNEAASRFGPTDGQAAIVLTLKR
jgi:hypothetical protein